MPVEVGMVLEGKVTGIIKFGAFVELPEGKKGMVYISEIAHAYVKEIRDHLQEGQTVKVKVINIAEDGKIGLSIKQAMEPPPRRSARPPAVSPGRPGGYEWQPRQEAMEFEDMLSRFKQTSDEKISDLKRSTDSKHGGFSRRGRSSGGNS